MTRGMIALIFDLGIRLATFAALAAAFFRKPGAGLQARNRPCGSVVAIPCQFPAGPRGRGNVFPARRVFDVAQVIDYTRNYRQNWVDFEAETKNFPVVREISPTLGSEHAQPEDTVGRVDAGQDALADQVAQGLGGAAAEG